MLRVWSSDPSASIRQQINRNSLSSSCGEEEPNFVANNATPIPVPNDIDFEAIYCLTGANSADVQLKAVLRYENRLLEVIVQNNSVVNQSSQQSQQSPQTTVKMRVSIKNGGICIMPALMSEFKCIYRFIWWLWRRSGDHSVAARSQVLSLSFDNCVKQHIKCWEIYFNLKDIYCELSLQLLTNYWTDSKHLLDFSFAITHTIVLLMWSKTSKCDLKTEIRINAQSFRPLLVKYYAICSPLNNVFLFWTFGNRYRSTVYWKTHLRQKADIWNRNCGMLFIEHSFNSHLFVFTPRLHPYLALNCRQTDRRLDHLIFTYYSTWEQN